MSLITLFKFSTISYMRQFTETKAITLLFCGFFVILCLFFLLLSLFILDNEVNLSLYL
jgi:hypothetical protein